MLLRTAAFRRAAAHAATATAKRSGGASLGGSCSVLHTSSSTSSHGRLPGSAASIAPFSSSSSSSSSSNDLPPPSSFESQQQQPATPQQPPSRPRRPSPRRGGGGRSGSGNSVTATPLSKPQQLPLDLPSYRQRLAQATDPAAALTTLDEMHRAGLSFDTEAALLALRLCTQPQPTTTTTTATAAASPHHNHLRDALRLLRRLTASTAPNSPVAHAAYALTLGGCLRGVGESATPPLPHESVLAAMRRQGVRPTVAMYQNLARACLEPALGGSGRRQGGAPLDVMRAVLEMDPWAEEGEGGGEGQGQGEGRLSVRCQDAGEAAWLQGLLQATSNNGHGREHGDVDAALTLLATGLQGFAAATTTAGPTPPAVAFACNLALVACIRQARWGEASAVEELMRGLHAPPDAWAVNALLARALMEEGGKMETIGGFGCSKGLGASRLLQGLLAAHPTLRPSASAYAAVLKHGGCDALLDLLAAMQRIRGPGAVPAYAYRMLLRALDEGDGARLVAEGLPLVAHADA